MPNAVAVRVARTAMVAGLIAVPFFGSPAGAAVETFSLSPASGPPGTVVSVNGAGCAPGLLLSSTLDYVQITVTTVPAASAHIAVAANGSWHGTFTVPANAAAAPALVSALCVSSGLQSLLTIYTPKTFTVTATAPVTIPPVTIPPVTTPRTTAPRGPADGSPATTPTTTRRRPTSTTDVPATTAPTDGSVTSTLPAATPGAHDSAPPPDPSPRPPATSGTHTKTARATRHVYAADLGAPDAVRANTSSGSGGLGWLLWLLLAGAIALALAPFVWRWMRGQDERLEPHDA